MIAALMVLLVAQAGGSGPNTMTRPDPEGVPTKVTATLYLLDLSSLNDVQQSFRADVFLAMEWSDPRLASSETDAERRFPLTQVWHPNLQVLNERSLTRNLPDTVAVSPDGTVTYKQRFIGTFTIPLHLADFPFDSHRLAISIVAVGYTPEEVAFVADSQQNGRAAEVTLAGWALDHGYARVRPYRVELLDRSVARFELDFEIRRSALFYLLRLIGPLLLIVLIGWGTCWISPLNTGAQLRLGATCFLTLVAYQFAVGGLLPKVSYLTRMDVFVAGVTLIIFLALGKAVLADYLVAKERDDRVLKINRVFRWVYFVAVLFVTSLAFAL